MLLHEGKRWTERAFGLFIHGRVLVQQWPTPGPSNCLIYALQQMEQHGRDGALIFVKSQYGDWLHVRYRDPDGRVWEFEPDATKYAQVMPPTLFEGHAREWHG